MYTRLRDVLDGREENYLLPFYWQHGDHTDKIEEHINQIYASGCRALCMESRPHPDFCGEGWWRDVDIIMSHAKRLGMKVWLLDDDSFPTGHANGAIEKKYPELRQWELIERHIDVSGPINDACIFCDAESSDHILLGAYAYRRYPGDDETCCSDGIDVKDSIFGDRLVWSIPDGVWRIFFYYQTRIGGKNGYIDMINPESVDVLIKEVYEPHYEHLKEDFGKTFAGFFSDEPCFGNGFFGQCRANYGIYESRIGTPSLALPWNKNVERIMSEKLGYSPTPYLNLLWYADGGTKNIASEIRFAYMDTVTELYRDSFSRKIGNWCREHGVKYIGHVIEDMNCHAHMQYGAGHFFRSMDGQDMSGMDIVLHQVIPGMADYTHTSIAATGVVDGEFNHYVLAKLCASQAHLTPHMKGRAMCEIFGAYGWAEDLPMMKWLIDFLLVRGINCFVPHAFSPTYPDPDCPPHFGAQGHDPSFEGFGTLMRYTNKAAHLLEGSTHVANVALLYHAEGEWASRYRKSMYVQKPAHILYDAHVDYDIVWMDALERAEIANGRLKISDEYFDCLVVPYADHLPSRLVLVLERLKNSGLSIFFVDKKPDNVDFECETIALSQLANKMIDCGFCDVIVEGDFGYLRIYHSKRDGNDIFMLFNENIIQKVNTRVTFPVCGNYIFVDMLGENVYSDVSSDGVLNISLEPYESAFVIFGDSNSINKTSEHRRIAVSEKPTVKYSLYLANSDNLESFEYKGEYSEFFNIDSPKYLPDFSGKAKYVFETEIDKKDEYTHVVLNLGRVGNVVKVKVNGKDNGIRICNPYCFDITSNAVDGKNTFEIEVSGTLAYKLKDGFSRFLPIPPLGLVDGIAFDYYL